MSRLSIAMSIAVLLIFSNSQAFAQQSFPITLPVNVSLNYEPGASVTLEIVPSDSGEAVSSESPYTLSDGFTNEAPRECDATSTQIFVFQSISASQSPTQRATLPAWCIFDESAPQPTLIEQMTSNLRQYGAGVSVYRSAIRAGGTGYLGVAFDLSCVDLDFARCIVGAAVDVDLVNNDLNIEFEPAVLMSIN